MGCVGKPSWDKAAWLTGFTTPRDELAVVVDPTSGALPEDLVGTYYRAGPALFELPGTGEAVDHPLDADGMVTAATFLGNGTVYFRNRFVRTTGFQKERRAGKGLYSGRYGNIKPPWAGGLDGQKNVANAAVLWWGGRLLALWDGGQPYKLDPLSLGTAGATDVSLTVPKREAFGSRPRVDTTIGNGGGRLVGFGVKPSGLGGATNVRVFEYEEDFSTDDTMIDVTLSGTALNGGKVNSADCATTNTWAIFAVSPPDDDVGAERGARGVFDALGGKGLGALVDQSGAALSSPSSPLSPPSHSPACFVFLRREAKREAVPIYVDLGAGVHVQHFVNAFEGDVDGLVTVDIVATGEAWPRPLGKKKSWAELDYASDVPKARLVRYEVDLRRPEVCEEQNNPRQGQLVGRLLTPTVNKGGAKELSPEQQPLELSERHVELPVINPTRNGRPYHFVWAACTAAAAPTISGSDHSSAAPPQGIVKVDVTSGGERERFWVCPEPHQFVGEPCFVPRRRSAATREGTVEEDDGYLVTFLVDGKTRDTELLVLDAADPSSGPVARVPVGTNIPHGLRGCWAEQVSPLADSSAEDQMQQLRKAKILLDLYERKSREWNQVDAGFSGLGIVQFFGQKGIDGR